MDLEDRDKLVEALLKCDCLARAQARNAIIRDLPAEVRENLNGTGTNRDAVTEMVEVSSRYADGIETLLQRVHYFERNSFSWQAVERVVAEIKVKQQPASVVIPAQPGPPQIIATEGYDVFLSHNGQDKPAVEQLAKRLEDEAGLKPFLDKWHLIPGEPWQEALEKALDDSRTYAVFLGASGQGPWENVEMRSALEERVSNDARRVIPVLLPGANPKDSKLLPRFLRQLTWVDFRNGLEDAEAFRRLVAGIRGQQPGRGM